MKPFTQAEIKALISLLDEENPAVLAKVTDDLRHALRRQPDEVEAVIPTLEPAVSKRVLSLIEDVRWDSLEAEFRRFAEAGGRDADLEEGVTLLSAFAYPRTRRQDIAGPLDEMAQDLSRILSGRERPLEIVHLLNDYLFVLKGFKGNSANYYDPDNSYFNRVLERKVGIPITLSILYLLVARRAALPVAGIGLPGHFIVQFQAPNQRLYLDPYRGGKILSVADCQDLLSTQGLSYDRRYFRPVTSRAIVARVIANLIHIYTDRGDTRKTERLGRLFSMLQEEAG